MELTSHCPVPGVLVVSELETLLPPGAILLGGLEGVAVSPQVVVTYLADAVGELPWSIQKNKVWS